MGDQMKTKILKLGRRLWVTDQVPKDLQRRYLRQWARSIKLLGDKWHLAKHHVPDTRT